VADTDTDTDPVIEYDRRGRGRGPTPSFEQDHGDRPGASWPPGLRPPHAAYPWVKPRGAAGAQEATMNAQEQTNTLFHERLDAYTVAVELDTAVVGITQRAGRGHAWIADQAMRASASVVLNLAEALGREGADRARALRIARGSALELDAALTLMLHRGACRDAGRKAAKALTVRVVAMLTALRNRAAS